MPDISEIVDLEITVQSAALTRQGFNSLMLLGVAADFGVGFVEYETRVYSTYKSVTEDTDLLDGDLKDSLLVAFAQSPSVPKVYISRVDALDAALAASDLDSVAALNSVWFGFAMPGRDDAADAVTASAWVAANKKVGWFRITSVATDLALASNYSSVWYNDTADTGPSQWLMVAIASRALATIPGSATVAFKGLEVVSTSTLTGTQEATLKANHVNLYTPVAGRAMTWEGVTSALTTSFIDTYIGALYLEARVAEDVFGHMASVEKVPYTNAGVDSLVGKVQARLDQSVLEGYLTNDPAPVASAPRVTEINSTDKSNRLLPNITFVAETAGAVHTVKIAGTIIA